MEAAADKISGLLKGKRFELIDASLEEEGELLTSIGVIHGKRYLVYFRQTKNVVFLHPDYYKVMERNTTRMRIEREIKSVQFR